MSDLLRSKNSNSVILREPLEILRTNTCLLELKLKRPVLPKNGLKGFTMASWYIYPFNVILVWFFSIAFKVFSPLYIHVWSHVSLQLANGDYIWISDRDPPFQIKPLHKTSSQSIFLFNLNVRKPLNCAPDILTCTILRDSINWNEALNWFHPLNKLELWQLLW